MTITREELAAFADGELDAARRGEIEAAVRADPALAAEVGRHRRLKATLAGHFSPILEAPVPERLTAIIASPRQAELVDFAAAKVRRESKPTLRRWTPWLAGPALAASLALALLWQPPGDARADRATGDLAAALDTQLSGERPSAAGPEILLSFRDDTGAYCRAYRGPSEAGLACREDGSWRIRRRMSSDADATTEYRQAGSAAAAIFAAAQEMAAGPALSPADERAARSRGWGQ